MEKFPKKIKLSLEKGKLIDKEWDNNNLYSYINDCINIENNIKIISKINLSNNYSFKECPKNIEDERKYEVTGENKNIITKTGNNGYMGTICENELDKSIEEHKWKIRFLKTENKCINIGVEPIDFDVHSSSYDNCGWYLYCKSTPPSLYSGQPYKYNGLKTKLGKIKDEVVLIMNMKKRTLKFVVNNEDKGDSYTDIPMDKPLFPVVLL